jgi:hypothetical protein
LAAKSPESVLARQLPATAFQSFTPPLLMPSNG